jgi:hypothetical protein
MKSVLTPCIVFLICFSAFAVPAVAQGVIEVKPATITGTLQPGETQVALINLSLPGNVTRGDVVFAFDTTGSMHLILQAVKEQGSQIMDNIRKVIPDTRFGAGSFMDYPYEYPDNYGYVPVGGGGYGVSPGDYAWRKDQDLTDDTAAVSAAINGIPSGNGGDWPQDYTRVISEARSYTWRSDAKKIYVIFGDAPPHAAPNGSSLDKPWEPGKLFTNYLAGAYYSYGGDPGPDEAMMTPDDLDYDLVIHDAAADHINIVGDYCPTMYNDQYVDARNNFMYMAYMTDGLFRTGDPNEDPQVIADQIVSMIQEMAKKDIKDLGLQVRESGFTGWMTSPDHYTGVPWPSNKSFNVAITPPPGTLDGDYTFTIDVVGDGVQIGSVLVTVHVSGTVVETPLSVSIDIKPGSCPNSFNIKEKGVLPVAILGNKSLKASDIDPKSIRLVRDGGTGDGAKPIRSSLDDVASASTKTCSCGLKSGRPDRKKDLELKFDSQDVVKKLGIKKDEGCIKVTITGNLRSGDPKVPGRTIAGSDYLRVLDTGHGTCGGGDSKDDKGSCGGKGSCDSGGSGKDKGSWDDGNPWDDGPFDHGHGNG